jgi:hypothetical protein
MKALLALLFVVSLAVAGCGNSSQPSAFCQSVATVQSDIKALKELKGNFTVEKLTTQLQKLQTDVNHALTEAKNAAAPKLNAVKSSVQQLGSTLTQVKDKQLTVVEATPTIKGQAQTLSQAWQELVSVEKC